MGDYVAVFPHGMRLSGWVIKRSSVPTWDASEWVGDYVTVFPRGMRLSG